MKDINLEGRKEAITMIPKLENEQAEQKYVSVMSDAERRQAAIALVQSWQNANEEDAQEQRETYDFLVKSLNATLLPGERRRI